MGSLLGYDLADLKVNYKKNMVNPNFRMRLIKNQDENE